MVSGMLLKADGTMQFREVRDELDEWYTLLGCEIIETMQIHVGDLPTEVTVICDGEGLLNGNDTPTVLDRVGKVLLVGNVFVCKTSPNGEFESLTEDDASEVINAVRMVSRKDGSPRPVLVGIRRTRTST